ncbi:MAG: hypothetical protein HYZ89_06595, partial [Candidatus Omnitrophica bacterium]|nr:hypothetical protein [Candidatus Omnitrophota bacterium]
VSSSRIRRLIQSGELEEAHRLLGRPVELSGKVRRGVGRARRLGFPTANVRLTDTLLPPRGVYQIQLVLEDEPVSKAVRAGKRFPGVMNLGWRPTFDSASPVRAAMPPLICEAHLVGFHGNLYGRSVVIRVLKRLRDERRFESPQALVAQIRCDLQKIC